MYENSADEWRDLTENYRSMSDDQLLELAEAFADLRPAAQQALRDELRMRKLGDPESKDWRQAPREPFPPPEGGAGPAVEYTWKTPLCDCQSQEQAGQFVEMLRRAGIESWIERSSRYSPYSDLDAPCPRLLVAADQLDHARMIIANPIPADIVEESLMTAPEYEVPVCPKCGTSDPILVEVDPVNAWECESCGAEWTDPA